VNVHANPILLTVEGIPARLEAGDDIPFLSRGSLNNIETVASNFQHTGVRLDITPYVRFLETDPEHKNPYVFARISTNLSTVTRYREEEGFAQPIIDTRQYTTSVWLKADSRILIGSIFRDTNTKKTRGIPIMKDIPLLGRFFRSSSNATGVSQLFVVIRPKILDIWGSQRIEESVSQQEQEFKNLRNLLDKRAREVEPSSGPFEQLRELFIERSSPE